MLMCWIKNMILNFVGAVYCTVARGAYSACINRTKSGAQIVNGTPLQHPSLDLPPEGIHYMEPMSTVVQYNYTDCTRWISNRRELVIFFSRIERLKFQPKFAETNFNLVSFLMAISTVKYRVSKRKAWYEFIVYLMGKVISFLWVLTPISSTISVIIVWVAMATSDWIRTQERILNINYNGSTDNKYILKMTYSGIWEICTVTDGDTEISCEVIKYFSSEPYYPDPTDSSVVIPYAVRQSVFFFIVASLVQLFGELGYLYGHYVRYRKVFIFIGGTIFIVSGLIMLIGMVMYISIFKSEVGPKFKHNSNQSTFNYQYGVSFVLYVSGFVCVELSGTCAVLLFVCQDQSVQSVHFIQPSPVIYRNYNTTATHPGMIYPCQKHADLCVAMDTLSHHSEHLYPSRREVEINQHYYLDPEDSPPYAPADQLSQYGDYGYHYRNQERPSACMQSATTQTISTIYDPYVMNDAETESNATDYQQREEFVSFDLTNLPRASSSDKMNTLRKSTLV